MHFQGVRQTYFRRVEQKGQWTCKRVPFRIDTLTSKSENSHQDNQTLFVRHRWTQVEDKRPRLLCGSLQRPWHLRLIINLLKPNSGEQNCTARNTTNTALKMTSCRLYFRTISFMVTVNSRAHEFRVQNVFVWLSTLQSFRSTSSPAVLFKQVRCYRPDLKVPRADSSSKWFCHAWWGHQHTHLIMFQCARLLRNLSHSPFVCWTWYRRDTHDDTTPSWPSGRTPIVRYVPDRDGTSLHLQTLTTERNNREEEHYCLFFILGWTVPLTARGAFRNIIIEASWGVRSWDCACALQNGPIHMFALQKRVRREISKGGEKWRETTGEKEGGRRGEKDGRGNDLVGCSLFSPIL